MKISKYESSNHPQRDRSVIVPSTDIERWSCFNFHSHRCKVDVDPTRNKITLSLWNVLLPSRGSSFPVSSPNTEKTKSSSSPQIPSFLRQISPSLRKSRRLDDPGSDLDGLTTPARQRSRRLGIALPQGTPGARIRYPTSKCCSTAARATRRRSHSLRSQVLHHPLTSSAARKTSSSVARTSSAVAPSLLFSPNEDNG